MIGIFRFVDYGLRVLRGMPSAATGRGREVIRQFDRVFLASLPIILVAGLSIGLVTWLQTRRSLATYGLEGSLPGVLLVAVVIETGPILVGLLLAGRIGAGLAAELGSMALTEQLEAREVLGTPIEPTIVAPRVWACLLAGPPLAVLIDASAFLGALGAEAGFGTLPVEAFLHRSLDFLKLEDAVLATLKTGIFGALVGLFGCWSGIRAIDDRSTESVGHAATRGVVASMLAVLLSNLLLVPYLQSVAAWFARV